MKQLEGISEPPQPIYAMHDEAQSDQAPNLRDFLNILRRRRAIALQAFVAVVALGVVVTLVTKPVYRSVSRVLVEGKSSVMTINNNANPLGQLLMPSASHGAETQVEILRSSQITMKAFKESGVAPGKAFMTVRRVASTDVIELSATSNNSAWAYTFLKAIPVVYLRDMRTDQMREVTAAYNFANKRLKEENSRLRKNELTLMKFRQKRNVIDPESQVTGDMQAVAATRTSLSEAEAQVDSLRAQLGAFDATRRQSRPEVVNPTTTTNTAELQALRQRIDELKSQRASSLYLYKENDDEIRKIDLQIKIYKERLARTPNEVTTTSRIPNPTIGVYESKIADTKANLQAAQANVSLIRSRLAKMTGDLKRYGPIQREEGQLKRDIEGSTAIVKSLSESAEELALRKKALESSNDPITVIESASQPAKISPNIARNLVLSIALGMLMACAAAFLQESLDDHMRDEEEVRRMLTAPILGHFPMMQEGHSPLPTILRAAQERSAQNQQLAGRNGSALSNLDREPDEGYAAGPDRNLLERFRVLRSNVQFTQIDRPHSTMLVTSTVPQEGKSYTASSLASAMALDGRRVILIDADLHRPRQHGVFNVPVQPGLTNVLVGQAELMSCLRETGIKNLRLLPAGVLPPNPVELLNSPTMESVMETLKGEADIIIFDSPPLLATADAQVLASKVDGVLYVMQLGSVPKSAVVRAFELLEQARANVLGIALNKIGGENNYSGYYSGYYGPRDDRDSDDSDDNSYTGSVNGNGKVNSAKTAVHS